MTQARSIWPATSVILITCLLLILAVLILDRSARRSERSVSLTFDRVIERGELHVGYLIEPPYLKKDAVSGRLSGVFFDFTEELGHRLGFKVVWVEEANLATLAAGLDNGRYDLLAFPLWRNASRARAVGFSVPLYYTPVGVYVRETDNRFRDNLERINDPSVTIAGMDGELAFDIARSDFPKAHLFALPQYSDYSQLLLDISAHKADVTFFDRVFADRFIEKNPGKIKDISDSKPIRLYADCFLIPAGDYRFSQMINAALEEMLQNGVLDIDLRRYGEDPSHYYRLATPYSAP